MYPGTGADKEPEVDDNKAVGDRVDKEGERDGCKGASGEKNFHDSFLIMYYAKARRESKVSSGWLL